jgi:hypothetical protein
LNGKYLIVQAAELAIALVHYVVQVAYMKVNLEHLWPPKGPPSK